MKLKFTRTKKAAAAGSVLGVLLAVAAPQLPSFGLLGVTPIAGCSVPIVDQLGGDGVNLGDWSPAAVHSPPLGRQSCPVSAGSPPVGQGSSPERDGDRDGYVDAEDNCAEVPNRRQGDADGDGWGDACDPTPGSRYLVLGGGTVGTLGPESPWFEFEFTSSGNGWPYALAFFEYTDTTAGQRFVATTADAVVGSATHMEFIGQAQVNGSTVNYRLVIEDNGDTGFYDVFSLTWWPPSNGAVGALNVAAYTAGPLLATGNIQIAV